MPRYGGNLRAADGKHVRDEFRSAESSHRHGRRRRVSVSTTIEAASEAVFAVLADPSAHADIDGTGWVRGSLDGDRITAAGQVFRMAMYHPNHPDGDYKIANLVEVFDEPRAIGWKPGHRVARDRGAQLRWLDLALRPRGDRPVADDGDADLRLVRGRARGPRVPPVPAVRARTTSTARCSTWPISPPSAAAQRGSSAGVVGREDTLRRLATPTRPRAAPARSFGPPWRGSRGPSRSSSACPTR